MIASQHEVNETLFKNLEQLISVGACGGPADGVLRHAVGGTQDTSAYTLNELKYDALLLEQTLRFIWVMHKRHTDPRKWVTSNS